MNISKTIKCDICGEVLTMTATSPTMMYDAEVEKHVEDSLIEVLKRHKKGSGCLRVGKLERILKNNKN